MDAKMKSMKLSVADRKTDAPSVGGVRKGPQYPWGLEIRLDETALGKLGMTTLPEVGQECMVHGVGEVIEVSERDGSGGKTRNVTIQMQRLAVSHEDGEEAFGRGYRKGHGKGRRS